MSNNLPTIAFRANLISRCNKYTDLAHDNIYRWTDLYSTASPCLHDPILEELLRVAWLSGLVTAVEAALNDTLIEILVAYPGKLSKKQLGVEELAETPSYLETLKKVARKAVNDLSYSNTQEYLEQWQKYVGCLSTFTHMDAAEFAEIKATRDIYVHNNGNPNTIYQRKSGSKARPPNDDKKIPIDQLYLLTASQLCRKLVAAISSTIRATYSRCTKEAVFEEMWNLTCCGKIVHFKDQWQVVDRPYYKKEFTWGWSSSEKALYDVFLRIFHGESSEISTDIQYALYRWPADTNEGQVIRSWLESPFRF